MVITKKNCSGIFAASMRVIPAMTGNPPLCNGQLWARAVLRKLRSYKLDSESIFQKQFGDNHGDNDTILWLSGLL